MTDALVPRGITIADRWIDQVWAATGCEPGEDATDRIIHECHWNRPCQDCGAQLGEPHEDGCDTARCLCTGAQRLGCENNDGHDCGQDVWDGVWPGTEAAVGFGWYCYFDHGWHTCGPEHPKAVPDLNRVLLECAWDRHGRRWVKR